MSAHRLERGPVLFVRGIGVVMGLRDAIGGNDLGLGGDVVRLVGVGCAGLELAYSWRRELEVLIRRESAAHASEGPYPGHSQGQGKGQKQEHSTRLGAPPNKLANWKAASDSVQLIPIQL